MVVINLLEALRRIAEHARLPEQFAALARHVDAIEYSAKHEIDLPADLESIDERLSSVRETLETRQLNR